MTHIATKNCPLCPTHIKARLPIYVDEYNCRDNPDGYCDRVIERTYYPAGGGTASNTTIFQTNMKNCKS